MTGHTSLSNKQDILLMLQTFVISPIGLIWAVVLCFCMLKVLCKSDATQNVYYRFAAFSATLSIGCALPNFLTVLALSNDAIFPLTFSNRTMRGFVDITLVAPFVVGKIAYYAAFSFHAQSILLRNRHKSASKFLNIWTATMSLFMAICGAWILIDVIVHPNEVTVAESDDTHISYLVPSTASNSDSELISLCVFALDVIYYAVLSRFYLKSVRSLEVRRDSALKEQSIKGLVLITASSLVFYATLVVGAVDVFTYIAVQGVDVISDMLVLTLSFAEYERAYRCLCGACDGCCTRCVFGKDGDFAEYDNPQALLSVNVSDTGMSGNDDERDNLVDL